ncbi:hypothetical protein [Kitasatospora purpeofusca]|uniref:hypothetical protein n=1 Tax=Kitasatospora purpeofusca TaxID=67352 RepID=UPI003869473D
MPLLGQTRAPGAELAPIRVTAPAPDLTGRKKSLPVVVALYSDTDAGRRLAELYCRGEPRDGEGAARIAGLIEAAGGREWALGCPARSSGPGCAIGYSVSASGPESVCACCGLAP